MYRHFFKRFFDFWIALTMFICIFPILFVFALILAIANGSSPFFIQKRPGKNGKIFKIVKFKTMNDKRDKDDKLLSDAERLTKIGSIVRSTSIDELPQLVNVIRGDMSFIGPRPLLIEYLSLYTKEQARRHDVRPGITGWAQINGRNAISWKQKFDLDIYYVENESFKLDFKIVFITIMKIVRRADINSKTDVTMEKFNGEN